MSRIVIVALIYHRHKPIDSINVQIEHKLSYQFLSQIIAFRHEIRILRLPYLREQVIESSM
jgi:hypothetical protein